MTGLTIHECDRCGREFYKRYRRNAHERTCGRRSAFEKADECPMCGEPYDDGEYLDHLGECNPDG